VLLKVVDFTDTCLERWTRITNCHKCGCNRGTS